ncbi:LacI family transcriptional regulator [Opitutaceae bacterium TAV4]|nr:LacI family transcriptional regulator [Opitutaceae bacterium TAV4]RRJ99613.1 LacI family transcriptional regulator [Opitutaceae bacterium TAV3]
MKLRSRSTITVHDVARNAGVSVGTVSRVLNGATNIAPENLKKVQVAIEELGYQKNHSAGLLATRRAGSISRTGNIGMVYTEAGPSWSNHPLVAAYTLGVEQACQEKGFHSLIELSGDGDLVPRCVRERKIDGLLIRTTRSAPRFLETTPLNIPVVFVGLNDPMVRFPQVAPDNQGAGWMMTDHLWQKGHRRIAFLCSHATHPFFIARLHGYENYLRQKQVFAPELVNMAMLPRTGDPAQPESAPPDMTSLLGSLFALPFDRRPTAILTANDWMARGLYNALAARGLRVPDDMVVAGFDNAELLCEAMTPPLTSFDMDFTAVARTAAMELFDMIATPAEHRAPAVHLVRGRLVIRHSDGQTTR